MRTPSVLLRASPQGSAILAATVVFVATFLLSLRNWRAFPGLTAIEGDALAQPPLLSLILGALAGLGSAPVAYGVGVIVLFVCFLAAVIALGVFGRREPGAWSRDALWLASSPIVLLVGLADWTLLPLALTATGLALLATGRTVPAALVMGLAACAGTMPIGVGVAVVVALGLRGGAQLAARFAGAWILMFLAVHLPLMASDLGRVWDFYRGEAGAAPGPGSLWMLAGRLGFEQPYAGSIGFAIACIALGCVFGLLRVTGRRPRVGSLIGIVVLSTVVLGPAFPPQSGLWVLFAVVVARPTRPALIAVTATQVGYALAHLAWADAVTAGTGVPWVYWLALVARVAVESWLTVAVLFDLLRPARDTVPTADLHDPLAGELSGLPTSGRSLVPAPPAEDGSLPARWRKPLTAAAIAVVVTRAAFLVGASAIQWLMVTDTVKPHLDWNIWLQWDAHHYIEIAENGYGPDVVAGNAPAFFPLFPLALRALMAIGIAPVHAGLLISAVATFVACAYLYRLAQLHGLDGDRAIIYLLLFPTGVFLTAGYTEALFLAGAVPAFYYAQRGRPWEAALFTAIAVGSRTVGLFVLLGVAIELARRAWPSVRGMISAVAAMVAASLPFWAYGLFLLRERGSFWAFMEVQRTGWGRDFVGFTDSLLATWRTWEGDYSANVIFSWRLEIVFAALSLGLLIWVMWRGYVGYAIYIGATLLIGLSNAWYYSTPRLALAFFPFAFLLAALVGRRERAHAMTVTAMTVLATVGLVAYTRGAWFF